MLSSLKALFATTVLTAIVSFAGCGGNGNGPETAQLRVLHASPDAPNVDVYVDNKIVAANVAYPTVSGYLTLASGAHAFKVNAAGTETSVINISVSLTPGDDYTAIAAGFVATIQPLLTTDQTTPPPAGQAALRVIHAAPDAGNVDVLVNNKVVLSNVPFGAISSYLVIPAGTYDVKVNAAGTSTTAIEASVTATAGSIYSAVAIGSLKTAATHPIALEVLTDG